MYSSSVKNNGLMCYAPDYEFDEELISWSIDGGGNFFYRPKHKYTLTNVWGYIRVLSKNLLPKYLYYQLVNAHAKKHFDYTSKAHPSVIRDLYDITIPCIEERIKIAALLSSIDDLISATKKEVVGIEEAKKGMMQKVFSGEVRFKADDGSEYPEWEEKSTSDIGKAIMGNTPSTKDAYNYGNKYVWVTPSDIDNNSIIVTCSNKMLTDKGYVKARKVPKGSVLVTCIASIGKNCILGAAGSCNQQINAIVPNDDVSSRFILNELNYTSKQLSELGGSGFMKIISKSLFEKFHVIIPCLEEQTKIASLFTAFDDEIKAIKDEISGYEMLKNGLMQQLFE